MPSGLFHFIWPGGNLLSHTQLHTIIGANSFHGPVRDGKAWFQAAIAARLALNPQSQATKAALDAGHCSVEVKIWVRSRSSTHRNDMHAQSLTVIGSSLTGN
jgi:hypothetical protein